MAERPEQREIVDDLERTAEHERAWQDRKPTPRQAALERDWPPEADWDVQTGRRHGTQQFRADADSYRASWWDALTNSRIVIRGLWQPSGDRGEVTLSWDGEQWEARSHDYPGQRAYEVALACGQRRTVWTRPTKDAADRLAREYGAMQCGHCETCRPELRGGGSA